MELRSSEGFKSWEGEGRDADMWSVPSNMLSPSSTLLQLWLCTMSMYT